MSKGNGFDARLSRHVDELVKLEEQRLELAEIVKERKAIIKGDGYEVKIVTQLVKERFRSKEDIERERAIFDLYRASIGGLDGTPMGDYARRELDKAMRKHQGKPEEPTPEEREAEEQEALKEAANLPPEETIGQARERGVQAAKDGKVLSANPYGPNDPRRAAWDEGWCQGAGRTGMEIPENLQRKKKKKKDGDGDGAGAGNNEAQDREAA